MYVQRWFQLNFFQRLPLYPQSRQSTFTQTSSYKIKVAVDKVFSRPLPAENAGYRLRKMLS
jgi:hypothetical protein